jgi:hypothetical protein
MAVFLDHTIVPSRNQAEAAKLLAEVLGVPWSEKGLGPFAAVYVNDGLTLDFQTTTEDFPIHHYCFRVSAEEFEVILGRIKTRNIEFRSQPHGPADMRINTNLGGKGVYWNEPDGHYWEILTVSYARPAGGAKKMPGG